MFHLPPLSIQRLRDRGVLLDPGLTDDEVTRVEDRVGFHFGQEHREFLQEALPVGEFWPDWRYGATEDLHKQLDWPVEGVLGHAAHMSFWPTAWGERPATESERERIAKDQLDRVPRLVPVYSHRYITVDPIFVPSPVFSIHEIDVIVFGDDLLDFVAREFHVPPRHQSPASTYVPFWSELAERTAAWECGR